MGSKSSRVNPTENTDDSIPIREIKAVHKFWRKHCLPQNTRNEKLNQLLLACLSKRIECAMMDNFNVLNSIGDILQLLKTSSPENEELWAMVYQNRAIVKEFGLDERSLIQLWKQMSQILLDNLALPLPVHHAVDITALHCISLLYPPSRFTFDDNEHDHVSSPIAPNSPTEGGRRSSSNLTAIGSPLSPMSESRSQQHLSDIRQLHFDNTEECLAHPFGGVYLCRYLESAKVNQGAIVAFLKDYRVFRKTSDGKRKLILGERLIAEYLYPTSFKSLLRRGIVTKEQAQQIMERWERMLCNCACVEDSPKEDIDCCSLDNSVDSDTRCQLTGLFAPIYRSVLRFVDRDLFAHFQCFVNQ